MYRSCYVQFQELVEILAKPLPGIAFRAYIRVSGVRGVEGDPVAGEGEVRVAVNGGHLGALDPADGAMHPQPQVF